MPKTLPGALPLKLTAKVRLIQLAVPRPASLSSVATAAGRTKPLTKSSLETSKKGQTATPCTRSPHQPRTSPPMKTRLQTPIAAATKLPKQVPCPRRVSPTGPVQLAKRTVLRQPLESAVEGLPTQALTSAYAASFTAVTPIWTRRHYPR